MPDRPITATYRLQLHADFDFAAARDLVPYLASLGVSHLYLSPVLQAAPGSRHGYDVVDHSRVSAALGGPEALLDLADEAHRHDLGLVVDVVPNHMALPTPTHLNPVLWEVLRDGPDAARAHWLDVDWDHGDGRLGLPILGDELDVVLERGELVVEASEHGPVLRYFDQVLPLAAGTDTGGADVATVAGRQHYRLASWTRKAEVLNYRRFFDVDTLIAVRVELADVFDATHDVLLELHEAGVVDGFRIDHPDGLADPEGYLARLREATGGAWVVVEKILAPGERLPSSWATAGTTGYDATEVIQAALAPSSGSVLDDLWRGISPTPLHAIEAVAKHQVVSDLLQPELRRLVRRAAAAARRRGPTASTAELEAAIAVLLTQVDRYRAYVRLGRPVDGHARSLLDRWTSAAAAERPDLAGTLYGLRDLLRGTDSPDPDAADLVVRFQQVCGPVMAKAVEDTTFYRFHRLVALNEVGGDPESLVDDRGSARLHDWALHQGTAHPDGLTALSTHDTKRDEDVRARLLAAGADVDRWRATWALVRARADEQGVDTPTAYLVMQTVLGAWPITAERLDGYLTKAVREAKQHTTWTAPDPAYEGRVLALGAACRSEPALAGVFSDWVEDLSSSERAVNLAAKLLQLTLPGVPDTYQGCEQVTRSLVDPDNRRPVDHADRARRLAELDAGRPRDGLDDDKLWVTSRTLRLRRELPDAFGPGAAYHAISASDPAVVGLVRGDRVVVLTCPRPAGPGATLDLPAGSWADVLTDRVHRGGTRPADELFADLPVALLRPSHGEER